MPKSAVTPTVARRHHRSRWLSPAIVATWLLAASSCYAPDVTHLLFQCSGSGPCPSGMECQFGMCTAPGIEACASGNGVWLTDDNFKALCPALASTMPCDSSYELDATCVPDAQAVCTDPVTGKPNPDCFRCCRKK
ncbi:MAG: hypothetical protein JNM83_01955 [Myxococcales bacterium]|nr:hypothetical protein [Myxococcales bacterium]